MVDIRAARALRATVGRRGRRATVVRTQRRVTVAADMSARRTLTAAAEVIPPPPAAVVDTLAVADTPAAVGIAAIANNKLM